MARCVKNIARLQEAHPDDVIAAASMVGMHDMIMGLPRGYDTDIGDGGMRLSGGLRQRLGLARAFFGQPRVLVLDEPNASLDAEGEDALRQAIQEMRNRGSTVIIIAQRLGILNLADKVLVLDKGTVNAFGNRRDIAEKIRNGRTSIPVRRPRITAAARSVRRLGSKTGSEQSETVTKKAVVKEKSGGNAP